MVIGGHLSLKPNAIGWVQQERNLGCCPCRRVREPGSRLSDALSDGGFVGFKRVRVLISSRAGPFLISWRRGVKVIKKITPLPFAGECPSCSEFWGTAKEVVRKEFWVNGNQRSCYQEGNLKKLKAPFTF